VGGGETPGRGEPLEGNYSSDEISKNLERKKVGRRTERGGSPTNISVPKRKKGKNSEEESAREGKDTGNPLPPENERKRQQQGNNDRERERGQEERVISNHLEADEKKRARLKRKARGKDAIRGLRGGAKRYLSSLKKRKGVKRKADRFGKQEKPDSRKLLDPARMR